MQKAGIRDVAAAAGVSLTTVSHVLNGKLDTRVSEETSTRVRQIAAELGYVPNRLARGLRTKSSDLLGLVTEEIAVTPYAGQIILGAQEEATKRNLTLAIVNAPLTKEEEVSEGPIQTLLDREAAGVIYATVYHDVVDASKNMLLKPSIIIGAREGNNLVSSVGPDEYNGAIKVVEMLHARGHHRIAFAESSDDVPATRGRLKGYLDAMKKAGLKTDGLIAAGPGDARGGYLAASKLLDNQPSAIFCYNDRMAMGVYRAVAERGLRIPKDVSVVGFDDQAPIPEGLFPSLTTVALPHYELGTRAVEMLADLVDQSKPSEPSLNRHFLLPCPIVERDSVASIQKTKTEES